MKLDITSFKNAVSSLDLALAREKGDFIRDSVIQRFECTYELSWKFLMRHLEQDLGAGSVDKLSRRDLYRLGAEKGLLRDAGAWFEYHTARNITSHSYNASVAEQVYSVAQRFSRDARYLLDRLVDIYG